MFLLFPVCSLCEQKEAPTAPRSASSRDSTGRFLDRRRLLGVGNVGAWEVRIRNSWPTVEATVTTLRLKLGTNMVFTKTGSHLEQTERVVFRYEYLVGGKTYASSRFHPLGFSPNEAHLTRHYPPGTKFKAHYNPAQPHRSFVEPGATSPTLILIGLGLVAYAGVIARWLRHH